MCHRMRSVSKESRRDKKEVTDVIKVFVRKEARRVAVQSQARRAIGIHELRHTLLTLKNDPFGSIVSRFGIPVLSSFQFSMMARIDDTKQLLTANLKGHTRFPAETLTTKLNWSKNVLEERDAPWQSLLGSTGRVFWVFVNLAFWLKVSLMDSPPPKLHCMFSCLAMTCWYQGAESEPKPRFRQSCVKYSLVRRPFWM